MSHFKERAEKNCLNCQAEVVGRYCHKCGQQNIEPKETVWGLVSHFFYDITHFDGKFFSSARYLFTRPGFLSREYISGRRASYLHPIRMYIFASAFFFVIFFSYFNAERIGINESSGGGKPDTAMSVTTARQKALQDAKSREDSLVIERVFAYIPEKQDLPKAGLDTPATKRKYANFNLTRSNYKSKAQYDSVQKSLPPQKRDGWFSRQVQLRSLELSQRYEGRDNDLTKDLAEKFLHSFPYLLFVSLPLYALFLKLLYIRRKKFYYVDHGIFLIHLYIFTFLFLLVFFGVIELKDALDWGWMGFVVAALVIYGIYYTYKAMRNFYGQGTGKTIVKFLLLNLLSFISILVLFSLFFILTVFRL